MFDPISSSAYAGARRRRSSFEFCTLVPMILHELIIDCITNIGYVTTNLFLEMVSTKT